MPSQLTNLEVLERARETVADAGTSTGVLESVIALLKEHRQGWDWIGIYLMLMANNKLVLGPYLGAATDHTEIAIGRGVCGSAVAENRNIIVEDVSALDNYLACSIGTRSEIVVLIRHNGAIVGQFDIDSDRQARFTQEDEELLQLLAPLVAEHCYALSVSRQQCGTA